MPRRTLTVGLVALGLLACNRGGLPPEQIQAWVGRPAAQLVREWGPATKELDDAGQRVLVYEEVERTGSAEFSRYVSTRSTGTQPTPPPTTTLGYHSYARSYLFWVDAAGTIVRSHIHQP
jgi:hypothetical protein